MKLTAENAEKELDIKFKTINYKLNSAVSPISAVKITSRNRKA